MRRIHHLPYHPIKLKSGALLEVKIISYWTGILPEITELHFRSYLAHHDENVTYHLYLEEGSTLAKKIAWLQDQQGIQIHYINLQKELGQIGLSHLLEPPHPQGARLLKAARRGYRRWLKLMGNRVAFEKSPRRVPLGWQTKAFGYTPRYSKLWNAPDLSKTMMGDLFRILYSTVLQESTLYVDLDTVFCADVRTFTGHQPFVYRWQELPCGNNAVIFVPRDSPIKQGALAALCKQLGTPLPWILFADKHCKLLDIKILPCAQFDPFWVTNPFGIAEFEFFFAARPDSHERAKFITQNCYMYHWHNQWFTTAQPDSTYDILLRATMIARE